jgi:diazepam-binding inhibitor (GABA receptor modulator, acyl-CoA-binding protein)
MLNDLDTEFKIAYEKISDLKKAVAPDVMLKLYAYNKQATFGDNFSFKSDLNGRSAFKFNAWMQLNGMSSEKAKKEYIKLANSIIQPKTKE